MDIRESGDLDNYANQNFDIMDMTDWSSDDLFALDSNYVHELQLTWLLRRFSDLRPKIAAVDQLASNIGIDKIDDLDDVIPLCLPHTMYKAYSFADVDKGRWTRLTNWLQTLTVHDLSKADLTDCKSLDDWLDRLEAASDIRPQVSSGTSGKISIFPRDVSEGRLFLKGQMKVMAPFADEPGLNIGGDIPFISPWPADTGRHHLTTTHRLLREHMYGGRHDMVISLSSNKLGADELWLVGKLRRSEANGEELILTPAEHQLKKAIAANAKSTYDQIAQFLQKAVIDQKGKKVCLMSSWARVYEFALACQSHGIVAEYDLGSVFMVGGGFGGMKGANLPSGFADVIRKVFPVTIVEAYGFSESTATARLCAEGFYHQPPWAIPFVLDPQTSEPYPRSGTQTGRFASFDLMANAHWSGTITGDEVTMHWDGGCKCGRKGPFLGRNIRRFTDVQAGDDKISCSKTPNAYESLVEFALSSID